MFSDANYAVYFSTPWRYMHSKYLLAPVMTALLFSISSISTQASPFTIDGSTVYVNAGFVGVRTSTPATVLDVNGDAQFGSGATKSTFTAAGLLKLTAAGIQWADESTSTTASSGSGGGPASLPTRKILLTGTAATYSRPGGVQQLRIRMVGGGGGGGSGYSGGTAGGNGGATSFGTIVASSGIGGPANTVGYSQAGGSGGTGGAGGGTGVFVSSSVLRMPGGGGCAGTAVSHSGGSGMCGWSSAFGASPSGSANTANAGISGNAAAANTGAGGTAGNGSGVAGGGGGAGEYVELIIDSPSASYIYTVGAGGAASTGATYNGAAGGSGIIIVDEIY